VKEYFVPRISVPNTVRSWASTEFAKRIAVLASIVVLLAACQSNIPVIQVDETLESLVVQVEPSANGSEELAGQTVDGTIVVSIPAEGWMKEVRFFLDGQRVHTATQEPFAATIDTTALANGPHTVGIEARMANGRVRVSQLVDFHVLNEVSSAPDGETPPPGSGDVQEPGDKLEPGTEPEPEIDPEDPPATTTPVARDFSLRGDPNFSRSQLTSYQRVQYDRLWAELSDPANFNEIMRLADRDDLFTYGRQLQSYIQSILTAFRVTGDLALLDHVDIIMERMRSQLDYGWRDTNDGTDGTWGKYLMWVFRYSSGPSVYGKDNRIDDLKTHGLIAMVAYALELNRDLASPSGRNYGAHADFWKHYLVDHFEAKLRDRFNKPGTVFPITHHSDGHTYYSWTKWHLYMGLLTGRAGYLAEANRMADIIWGEIRSANTAAGPAYVWTSNISQLSSSRNYLMTTSYAHSIYGDVVTFHFEGFHNWAQEEHLQAYARTITQFVFDTTDIVRNGITADIGGDSDQAGIESDSGRPRRTANAYTAYQYALISPWDQTGRIYDVSHLVQDSFSSLDTTRLAAGLFLGTHIGPTATRLAGATAAH
jgi:hypothetical protein